MAAAWRTGGIVHLGPTALGDLPLPCRCHPGPVWRDTGPASRLGAFKPQ